MPQQGTNSMHAGRSFSSRIFIKKDALWHSVLFASGCEKLLYPWRVSGRLVVMYHNVLPDDAAKVNVRQICQSDFRKQLLYLKKRYTVVSLSDFFLDGGINNRIAITLDDGLVNNLRFALPVLEEVQVPATVFVCTPHLIGQHVLWPDALEVTCHHLHEPIEFDGEQFLRKGLFHFNQKGERLVHCIKHLSLDEKWEFIHQLAKRMGKKPWEEAQWENHCRVMNAGEIKSLSQSPFIEIGSHCIAHSNLEWMSDEETLHELSASKKFLEGIIGKKVVSLAFPDGSYSGRTVELAQQARYTRQLAVNLRSSEDHNDSRLAGRYGFYSDRSCTEQLHQMNKFFHYKIS